jgi:hypothetical protein
MYLRATFGHQGNFHKSEIFYFGETKELECQYKQSFGCETGSLPFRYLGIPQTSVANIFEN